KLLLKNKSQKCVAFWASLQIRAHCLRLTFVRQCPSCQAKSILGSDKVCFSRSLNYSLERSCIMILMNRLSTEKRSAGCPDDSGRKQRPLYYPHDWGLPRANPETALRSRRGLCEAP